MGIKWQTKEDVSDIGRRIATHDEPSKQNFLKVRARLVARLKGKSYGGANDQGDTTANDVLEFVANLEPDLAFQLPEAEVYTDKGGVAYGVARGLHHAFGAWMKDTKYELEIRKSANEYCLGYAVRARGIGPRPGYESEGVERPWSTSVPAGRFGWDTRAESFQDAEYAYQHEKLFHHDLLSQARKDNEKLSPGAPGYWDLSAIERMGDNKEKGDKIGYYVVYLPNADAKDLLPSGTKHPERYFGVQLYLNADTADGMGLEIRKPTPHYGPNPYTLIGMQRIPDESTPVSVLMLTIDQAERFNEIVASNNQGAIDYKSIVVCRNQKLAKLIQSSRHRHVYYDTSFGPDAFTQVEFGGVEDQGLLQEQRAKEAYYRAVGLTDIERGGVEADVTATQTAVAAGASTKRREGQVNTFQLGIEEDMAGILWLLYHTDTVIVDLGPEAAEEGKSAAPVFFGGEFDKNQVLDYYKKHYPDVKLRKEDIEAGPDVPFSDLQLRVRLGSMGRKSKPERLMESQAEGAVYAETAGFLIAYPFIRAKSYVQHVAKTTGFVEMPDHFDFAWVEMMRAAMMQAGGVPPSEPPTYGTAKAGGTQPVMQGGSGPKPMVLRPQNMATGGRGSSSQGVRNAAARQGAA